MNSNRLNQMVIPEYNEGRSKACKLILGTYLTLATTGWAQPPEEQKPETKKEMEKRLKTSYWEVLQRGEIDDPDLKKYTQEHYPGVVIAASAYEIENRRIGIVLNEPGENVTGPTGAIVYDMSGKEPKLVSDFRGCFKGHLAEPGKGAEEEHRKKLEWPKIGKLVQITGPGNYTLMDTTNNTIREVEKGYPTLFGFEHFRTDSVGNRIPIGISYLFTDLGEMTTPEEIPKLTIAASSFNGGDTVELLYNQNGFYVVECGSSWYHGNNPFARVTCMNTGPNTIINRYGIHASGEGRDNFHRVRMSSEGGLEPIPLQDKNLRISNNAFVVSIYPFKNPETLIRATEPTLMDNGDIQFHVVDKNEREHPNLIIKQHEFNSFYPM